MLDSGSSSTGETFFLNDNIHVFPASYFISRSLSASKSIDHLNIKPNFQPLSPKIANSNQRRWPPHAEGFNMGSRDQHTKW